jgi:hypothetical protein
VAWPSDIKQMLLDEAKTRPWEKHIKPEDRMAARELFKQVRQWDPKSDLPIKTRFEDAAAANVERMLSVTPGLKEWRAQKLQEFDDRIAHAWDEAIDNSNLNKVQFDALFKDGPLWEKIVGPIEREKAEWDARNPAGLNARERVDLLKTLNDPSLWNKDGTFQAGRFTFQMSVANAVPLGDGGTMTSSLESKTGGSNSVAAADTRGNEGGFNIGIKKEVPTPVGNVEVSAGYTSKDSTSHTDTRSRTEDAAGTSRVQVTGPAELQQVTLRATVIDQASGARTNVDLDRIMIKTSK